MASLFSTNSPRNACMSSKQTFSVVLWVLVPGTGCMAASVYISCIIINAFCSSPGVKDGDQINFAPDSGLAPAVQGAQHFCTLPLPKTCLQCCVWFCGICHFQHCGCCPSTSTPSKALPARLHCLVML